MYLSCSLKDEPDSHLVLSPTFISNKFYKDQEIVSSAVTLLSSLDTKVGNGEEYIDFPYPTSADSLVP